MVRKFEGITTKSPRVRAPSEALGPAFFPGEAAEILGLGAVDHARLRRLKRLRDTCAGRDSELGSSWLRLDITDLVAIQVLIDIGGGQDRLRDGRRVRTHGVVQVCERLRTLGHDDPLVQVPLARHGSRVVAYIAASWIEPASGQLLFDGVIARADAYLSQADDPAEELLLLRAAMAARAQSIRPRFEGNT
jgi:hypothetical protein